jgi:hypothetical protein
MHVRKMNFMYEKAMLKEEYTIKKVALFEKYMG